MDDDEDIPRINYDGDTTVSDCDQTLGDIGSLSLGNSKDKDTGSFIEGFSFTSREYLKKYGLL